MTNAFRSIYRYWAALLVLAVIVQIAFAGYGAFDAADTAAGGALDEEAFDDSFGPHAVLGSLLVLASLLLFLFALAARVGRTRVLHSLGIFVLVFVQMLLGWFGESAPWFFGILHPVNAFIILGAIGAVAAREWRGDRVAAGASAPAR